MREGDDTCSPAVGEVGGGNAVGGGHVATAGGGSGGREGGLCGEEGVLMRRPVPWAPSPSRLLLACLDLSFLITGLRWGPDEMEAIEAVKAICKLWSDFHMRGPIFNLPARPLCEDSQTSRPKAWSADRADSPSSFLGRGGGQAGGGPSCCGGVCSGETLIPGTS